MAHIMLADSSDLQSLAELRTALWPESTQDDHAQELAAILDGSARRVLPLAIFIAEDDHSGLAGFLEAGLRSGADGCDESRPVGYVEGWYVAEQFRCQGIGTALLLAAESWARAQGCTEIASDAAIESQLSQRVHESSGFTVTARSVLYRKAL